MLIACDYYATSDYINEEEIDDFGILDNIESWQRVYSSSPTYKSIQTYKDTYFIKNRDLTIEKDINNLRSELFLEAHVTLLKNINENIFYLEAPTGSGKTNTSIQLALTLLKKGQCNKLIYVFPFNTLVEQTKSSLDHIFSSDKEIIRDLTVINSITPIKSKTHTDNNEEQLEDMDYNKMLLDRQFFHYPCIITSHVQLFNVFFSNEKMQACALYQLANSVIVLDEIQSYKNTIWKEIILFLRAFAKMLNIKIIIMSATLPKLDELLEEEVKIPSLITNKDKYFTHSLFKDRVKLDFSLLEEENIYDALLEKILFLDKKREKNILIEFITKKTAIKFYNKLMELKNEGDLTKKVLLITGDDHKWEREKCIKEVKTNKEIILVATQVIEAGVDIDMDIGFKDISLLDLEEQFMGRINRSCKKEDCYVYFFNLDNSGMIYKNDYRKNKEYTVLNEEMRNMLVNKNFTGYYRYIFQCIKEHNKKFNEGNLDNFKRGNIQTLDYIKIKQRMQLIDEDIYPITVFLGIEITIEDDKEKRVIDGRAVWQEYKKLLEDHTLSYAEKKVKLSYLREKMEYFTWRVSKCNVSYSDRIGDIYYIENGEEYFENGKFNREKISGSSFEIL